MSSMLAGKALKLAPLRKSFEGSSTKYFVDYEEGQVETSED
jgi:hypothetical protein